MALKRILAAAAYALLNDAVKSEYKQVGEEYHLDVEGEDFSHVVQKKGIAEQHRRAAEQRVEELENTLNEMRRGNIPKGDVEALEASHNARYAARDKAATEREGVLMGAIEASMREGRALAIAKDISNAPDLLAPVLQNRMKVVEKDGRFELQVIDKLGVAGVMSLDDLVTEVKADARYASVIIGSKASGGAGGAGGGGGSGGAGGGSGEKKFSEMTEAERTEFYKRDPEGFRKAAAAQ